MIGLGIELVIGIVIAVVALWAAFIALLGIGCGIMWLLGVVLLTPIAALDRWARKRKPESPPEARSRGVTVEEWKERLRISLGHKPEAGSVGIIDRKDLL